MGLLGLSLSSMIFKYINIFHTCLFREVETASAMDQSGTKPTILPSPSSTVDFIYECFVSLSQPLIRPLIPKEIEKENSVIVINVKSRETQIQILPQVLLLFL